MKYLRKILIFGTLVIILGVGIYLGRNAARKHVNYITAVEDHPLTCWSCHVYTQKDNFIAKMMNEGSSQKTNHPGINPRKDPCWSSTRRDSDIVPIPTDPSPIWIDANTTTGTSARPIAASYEII